MDTDMDTVIGLQQVLIESAALDDMLEAPVITIFSVWCDAED